MLTLIPNQTRYSIDKHGTVIDLDGRVCSMFLDRGHPKVALRDPSGKFRNHYIAKLVLLTHAGPQPSPRHYVKYIDGNPLNYHFVNLSWSDEKKERTGFIPCGEELPNTKLTAAKVRKIRQRRGAGDTFKTIARRYKISPNHAYQIASGKRWKHVA